MEDHKRLTNLNIGEILFDKLGKAYLMHNSCTVHWDWRSEHYRIVYFNTPDHCKIETFRNIDDVREFLLMGVKSDKGSSFTR